MSTAADTVTSAAFTLMTTTLTTTNTPTTTNSLSTLSTSTAAMSSTTNTTLAPLPTTTITPRDLQGDVEVLQQSITAFYLIIMGALVWAMQIGFAFLEAGTIRQKNVVNSLTRIFMNGWISALMWWLVGYAFAFGTGNGFIGYHMPVGDDETSAGIWALGSDQAIDLAKWFFEYVFCAASAAIISGSVAEHITHHGFILYCMFFTGWVYPVGAHWEWGSDGWLYGGSVYRTTSDNPRAFSEIEGNDTVYYYKAEYQDFAGSGVVHIMGSFAGLALIIILGPRRGMKRSFSQSPAEKPAPHSLPLTTLGSMLLTFGFFAFNGGSKLSLHNHGDAGAMSTAVCNTTISGAGGAISAILWHKVFGYFRVCYRYEDNDNDNEVHGGKWSLLIAINGSLAGMVAICAGCDVYYPWGAFVVGVIAGLQFVFWVLIITKLRLDDPMDTFAVHGGAGTWGALAVALLKRNGGIVVLVTDKFGTHGNCTTEGWTYFAWQVLGVVSIAAWAFVNMAALLLVFRGIDRVFRTCGSDFRLLRPSGGVQEQGLDEVENNELGYHPGDLVLMSNGKGINGTGNGISDGYQPARNNLDNGSETVMTLN